MHDNSTKKNKLIWPSLPYEQWKDTLDTLHLWMQIPGKVKLALCPFINQWWEVAFYITSRGITSGRIPYKSIAFEVMFDFIAYKLYIQTNEGKEKIILLQPRTVSEFYKEFMASLKSLGVTITINSTPSEITDPIPFEKDNKHRSYEEKFVMTWWQIMLRSSFIFDKFRTNFRGKSSPVQFFWGSFDLSATRFSGKKLPDKTDWPKGYSFMRYAENEENFAIGFWPGDEKFPYPAFYSYMNPAPKGYETIKTGPAIAYFNRELSLCVLPYEEFRKTKSPEKEIMSFLETTYLENAKLAKWNTKEFAGLTPRMK